MLGALSASQSAMHNGRQLDMADLQERRRPRVAAFGNSIGSAKIDANDTSNRFALHQSRIDSERETRIDILTLRSMGASSVEDRRRYFELLRAEIANRSLEQVRRMEIAKGLRAA
jgi:hypothetical protein